MSVAKNTNFRVRANPAGGFTGTLACPAPGCGAAAIVTSSRNEGPYTGSCDGGHKLSCPSAKEGPALS